MRMMARKGRDGAFSLIWDATEVSGKNEWVYCDWRIVNIHRVISRVMSLVPFPVMRKLIESRNELGWTCDRCVTSQRSPIRLGDRSGSDRAFLTIRQQWIHIQVSKYARHSSRELVTWVALLYCFPLASKYNKVNQKYPNILPNDFRILIPTFQLLIKTYLAAVIWINSDKRIRIWCAGSMFVICFIFSGDNFRPKAAKECS